MAPERSQSDSSAKPQVVTTNTGRILRVDIEAETARAAEAAKAVAANAAVVANKAGAHPTAIDPARRADVLFRVRRDAGHEPSPWWAVGAFVVTSGLVVLLLGWVPGGA